LNINTEILLNFVINRGWLLFNENEKFYFLKPPTHFEFSDDFSFQIPRISQTVDYERFLLNSIQIIADIYELNDDDLVKIIEYESEILSIRIVDKDTLDGSISFSRFENLIEKIKSILLSTASFVISKDPLFTKSLNEAEKYLNHCTFLQTEKGSYISKINLPTTEKLVEETLFGEQAIYAKDINLRIKHIISYLNDEIFSDKEIDVDFEYIQQRKHLINLNLLKQFEEFYTKVEIENVHFTFDGVESSKSFSVEKMDSKKLNRLEDFIKNVDEILNTQSDMTVVGKIIALRSRNPDGTTNTIRVLGITEDRLPVMISANLNSEDYKKAIELHKDKTQIIIKGLAKKEKTQYRFLRVDSLESARNDST